MSVYSTKVVTSKKWNFWNYEICQDILKEQCPRGILTKNEHFGANCLWDVSRLYSENSKQTLLIFFGLTQKNLEGFVWSFLNITGLRSQRQFAPERSFLASRPRRKPWQGLFRIIFILIRCVFLSPVRRYLQIFLGLYKANREIRNKRFVYKFCLPIGDCIVSVGT